MNILLLGATGSIGKSVLSVINQNNSELSLFGIAFNKNTIEANNIVKTLRLLMFILMIMIHSEIKTLL